MANEKDTEKSKQDADDWRNIECWVEDDFDANELLRGLDSAGRGATQDNEEDWADWSGDEGLGEGKARTAAKTHDNSWVTKGKVTDDPMEKSWRKASKLEKVPRGRRARGEESRIGREKPRRLSEPHHNVSSIPHEPSHERRRRGGRRRGKEPDLFPSVKKEKQMDEMSSAFARLMPVAGWQPAAGEEARGEEEAEFADEGVDLAQDIKISPRLKTLPHVHEERLRLIQPKQVQVKEEEPRSRRHRSRHRKSKSAQKEKSPEPNHTEVSHPVRLRYSEEPKQSSKTAPATAKEKKRNEAGAKEANNKKKPILESKWAALNNDKADDTTVRMREQYRQKKIDSQLDWDNGVKGTADDHASAKEAVSAKSAPSNSLQKQHQHQQQHQHFAYENSEPPARNEHTPKSKAKSKLTSMWA